MTDANQNPFPRLDKSAIEFEDHRGWVKILFEADGVILKRSFSRKGVFRGLHYQTRPNTQTKIVRVVSGLIVDFVMDAQEQADPIFHTHIYPDDGWVKIDKKYAHGFLALEDTVFEYFCIGEYSENGERTFRLESGFEQLFGIERALLSEKDMTADYINRSLLEREL